MSQISDHKGAKTWNACPVQPKLNILAEMQEDFCFIKRENAIKKAKV